MWFVPAGTVEQWRADLGLSYAQAGAVLSAAAPGALLVGTWATVAADRVSRRLLASTGAAVFAAAMTAFAAGHSFAAFLTASFVAGAAATAMLDACEVALVDVAGDGLRPALARANLLGVAGDVAGPVLVVATTAAGLSWRWPFALLAVVLAAYAFWLARSPVPGPPAHGGRARKERGERGARGVLRDRRVWFLGFVSLLTSPLDEPYLAFVIAYLMAGRGLSATAATVVATVVVAGGAALMTAGACGVLVAPTVGLVAVAGFVFGMGLSLTWLGVQHRTLTLRPGEAGATKALVSAVEMAGVVIPIAIGALADAVGLRAGLLAYAALPLLLFLLFLLFLRVGRIRARSVHKSFQLG